MRYLSVCSGIEAATVAWHDLGWKPSGFSEIEPFPSQVLAHHYPDVQNYGDMTNFKRWDCGETNILVGGAPCQSFSVAGLRAGLDDPRGNLALVYCSMLDHFRPTWFVWENVPGVLSSNKGRDFGAFLGAVAELGYGFAYRVLDAQYFGVAQRRRRVFVVGHIGDWRCAAAVLFERQSLCRDSKPSRETGQKATWSAGSSATDGGQTAPTVTSKWEKLSGGPAGSLSEVGNSVMATEVYENHPTDSRIKQLDETCSTVTARWGTGGGNTPLVSQPIPISSMNHLGRKSGDALGSFKHGAPSYTLTKAHHHGVNHDVVVRRLTPIECERLQGFPDGYTQIEWRNKPADQCPDSHRYKALGNSMAVPVMRWIGERIDAVSKLEVSDD